MTAPFKYQAFISYSHADRKWADWIHKALETYRIPKRLREGRDGNDALDRIAPVFKDREELASGHSLSTAITTALDASRCLVVICSPHAAASRWVNEEVLYFHSTGRLERVFCLVVDGDPAAPAEDPEDCFVPALRTSGAEPGEWIEPLAADVRVSGDGRSEARLKIIAGILGVGLDELKQRELQRRNRRLVMISSASVVGMALAAVLTTATLLARQEAERQKEIAEREAATANQTTEFLVDLFSVVDPSEARGRSVTAHEILEVGRRRIVTGLEDQPVVRRRLMTTMGRVYTGLGIYDTALELLQSPTTESPTMEERVTLAHAFYMHGDYEEAIGEYQIVTQAYDSLLEADRNWSQTYSNAFGGLANALIDVDQLQEAERNATQAISLDRDTWGEAHAQYAKNLGILASVLLFMGRLEESEAAYRQSLDAHVSSLGADHPLAIRAVSNLATVLYLQNDHDSALAYYEQALPEYRIIYGDGHPETASLLNNIGRIYLLQREFKKARTLLDESVAIDRALGRDRHADLVFSINSLAIAEVGSGNSPRAMQLYDEGIRLASDSQHEMLGPLIANRVDQQCSEAFDAAVFPALQSARQSVRANFGAQSWRLAVLDSIEGFCRVQAGQAPEGRKLMETALKALHERWGEGLLYTAAARERLEAR